MSNKEGKHYALAMASIVGTVAIVAMVLMFSGGGVTGAAVSDKGCFKLGDAIKNNVDRWLARNPGTISGDTILNCNDLPKESGTVERERSGPGVVRRITTSGSGQDVYIFGDIAAEYCGPNRVKVSGPNGIICDAT